MERGILYVASRPASPEREAEFNTWYEEVHLREICALPGFVSARRYAPVEEGGPYVSLYELEGEDLNEVVAELYKAAGRGGLTMSDSIQLDPRPEMQTLRFASSYPWEDR